MIDIKLNDVLVLKKGHACGGNRWKIIRYGADIKLECQECNRIIMMSRVEVRKRVKKIIDIEE